MRAGALCAAALAALSSPSPFAGQPKDRACVAWRASKRVWMILHLEAVGVSCEVKVRAVEEKGARSVRVSFPASSLRSGEPLRDFHVQESLGAASAPLVEFVSRPYSPNDWAALRSGKAGELEGRLLLGGGSYPLRLPFTLTGSGAEAAAEGAVMTSLKDFDISAPVAQSPVLMKVEDAMELDYRVPLASLDASAARPRP